jgi:hypothetical protein
MTLNEQSKAYMAWLPTSHPEDEGKFALVCQGLVTVHDTSEAAHIMGFDLCGSVSSFIVVHIDRSQSPTAVFA